MSQNTLPERPRPSKGRASASIAADDAGAASMAERIAREASRRQINPSEKARLGAEASRDEDA